MGDLWRFIQDPYNAFGLHVQQSLHIIIVSLLWAIVIGVPLGILSSRNKPLAFVTTNLSGLGRAIPTIAFFGFAVTSSLGIGEKPAIISMAVLGIPPILLNTISGLRSVDPAVTDAARGMGMTSLQTLLRVQLPLVAPVVMAGIRTSAVQIVATSPLASLIGAGGLGDYILGGIGLVSFTGPTELLAGVIPVMILALIAEYGLAAVQRAITPKALRTVSQRSQPQVNKEDSRGKGVVAM